MRAYCIAQGTILNICIFYAFLMYFMYHIHSVPGSGRSRGEGNGNPLQDSCLENPMNRGTWRATGSGVTKNQT